MELRLGDLYDLVVRIVDERLRQLRLSGGAEPPQPPETPAQSKPPPEPAPEWRAVLQQLKELAALQQQFLTAWQQHQQRTEALLDELVALLSRLLERQHLPDGVSSAAPAGEPPKSVRDGVSGERAATVPTATVAPAVYVPPTATLPTGAGAESAVSPALPPNWAELLTAYLQRTAGLQVHYFRERQMPAALEEGGAKVLVGEGTRNGQPLTIAALGKDRITAPDVSIFYNAVIKPLRASVTEPVLGVVVGQEFEPKADRVAYAHELLTLTVADLLSVAAN